jgi:site-specific DNA-methyltransferase (adenine-specific)
MVSKTLFSSETSDWQTPIELYKQLDKEFHFDLDPCTTKDNPLGSPFYFSLESGRNGLHENWVGSVFVNPPYNKEITKWIEKAYFEFTFNSGVKSVVFLLPARTDTKWFHKYIYDRIHNDFYTNVEVRFLKGRLTFVGAKNPAPFPSMVVIFKR